VVGFKSVAARAAPGTHDSAYLYDTAGNNVFAATPTSASFQGGGFFNQAVGFATVVATAAAGTNDTAYLYDGAGSNTFVGTAGYSYLTGSSGYFNEAAGFRAVYAFATGSGASDTANLFAAPGGGTFVGQGSSGILYTTSDSFGSVGFGQVNIVANQSGFDQAFLSSLFYVLTEIGLWH
jgi:hypothetical protein